MVQTVLRLMVDWLEEVGKDVKGKGVVGWEADEVKSQSSRYSIEGVSQGESRISEAARTLITFTFRSSYYTRNCCSMPIYPFSSRILPLTLSSHDSRPHWNLCSLCKPSSLPLVVWSRALCV